MFQQIQSMLTFFRPLNTPITSNKAPITNKINIHNPICKEVKNTPKTIPNLANVSDI